METIKTAIVVLVLLAILYGVYMVLNKPEAAPPPEAAWQTENITPPQVQLGEPTSLASLTPAPGEAAAPAADPPGQEGPAQTQLSDGAVAQLSDAATDAHASPRGEAPEPAAPSRLTVREAIATGDQATTQLASANVPAGNRETVAGARSPEPEPQDVSRPVARPAKSLNLRDDVAAVRAFDSAWRSAVNQMHRQEWTEALLTLSLFYNEAELNGEERQRLVDLLDPLAGRVIYSREHTLLGPHVVRQGETLEEVAQHYRVTPNLLLNINGLADPRALQPGAKLKVVQGPFRAEIDLKRGELAVFIGKYYAGRFPVSVGNDPPPQPADYQILAKQPGHDYQTATGSRIPARAPDNPYGNVWFDLGEGLTLHGTPETPPAQAGLGCISMSPADAADVYDMLTVGSKVLIR